ncbi:MAG: HD domain-containing protein [Pseudomonadota bacterium]
MTAIAERPTSETIVAFIADIFKRRGADSYLGEDVTMSQHMLQCAQLAERAGADDDVVAAALLHDIGHYTSEFGAEAHLDEVDNLHEEAGGRLLDEYFPKIVTDCVRHHVAAKRYLCATNDKYFSRLSSASVLSLKLQGGPMSDEEVAEFSKEENLKAILRVRVWDDEGKDPEMTTPEFDHYAPLLERVVQRHATA